jgi:hypothetical protein
MQKLLAFFQVKRYNFGGVTEIVTWHHGWAERLNHGAADLAAFRLGQ